MKKKITEKIDEALFHFYLGADRATISESINLEIGDIEQYNKRKKQILFLVKAQVNKQKDQRLLALVEKFQQAVEKNIERPVAILKQIINGDSSLAYYNKLEKFSKDDIIEIIRDKNLVELLEQLEKDESEH